MDWRWFLLLFTIKIIINEVENKELIAQINTKRMIHYVPERFLSMSVDPASLFLAGELDQQALKMARGLYPSFVRLGGKATNYLKFGKELLVDNNTITEDQWDGVNKFIEKAGLDLITSLNPTHRMQGVWDSRDALQLISYSDKNGYNVAWQLGYDTEGQLTSGNEIGRDIVRLRKILDGFKRYTGIPLFGPDLPEFPSKKEINYIRDLLMQAGPVLGAVLIQMPFSNKEDPNSKISNILLNLDSHVWGRELRFGRSVPKKPIWLVEKYPSQGKVEDAISLAKYLGTAAQTGCQIVLRQVGPENIKHPTPDFWLALIYKNLVGRGVFDAKLNSGNNSEISLFSHCSHSLPEDRSILDTGFFYGKGAVTVFGVNESPENVKLLLKASMKEEEAHLYILSFEEDSESKNQKTLLNGQQLTLSPSGDLPIISPKIKRSIKNGLNIPAGSIFFIVLPNMHVRTCTSSTPFLSPDSQTISKKLVHIASDIFNKPTNDLRSDEEDKKKVYVKFSKSVPLHNTSNAASRPLEISEEGFEPDVQVKYITFNENSWLSKLTETMGNAKIHESFEDQSIINDDDKYAALSAAIAGSQNNSDSSTNNLEPLTKMRRKRSFNQNSQITDVDTVENNQNGVASQEELVKHLNQYASTVYRASQAEESDKEIQISNIPPEIFNTLKKVKVTFKNLNAEDSQKEIKENINTNGQFQEKGIEYETKEATPVTGFLVNNDGTMDPVVLDNEKNSADSMLLKNKVLDVYTEEKSQINQRVAKEINENEQQQLGGNAIGELSDRTEIEITPLKNSQEQESYQVQPLKTEVDGSLEVESQQLQAENEGKLSNSESALPPVSAINFNYENAESKKSDETNGDEGDNENLESTEILISDNKGQENKIDENESNHDLNNSQNENPPIVENGYETKKNVVLLPEMSSEPENVMQLKSIEDEEQQSNINGQFNENRDKSETGEISSLSQIKDNNLLNDVDNNEKILQISESPQNEESHSDENSGSSDENLERENNKKMIQQNGNYMDIQQVSSPDTMPPENSINQNLDSMKNPKSFSLILPQTNEVQLQGLEDGPDIPSYNSETIKVQREVPLIAKSENAVENAPLVIVPIAMEPELKLQDEMKNEKNNENLYDNLNIQTNKDSPAIIDLDNLEKNSLDSLDEKDNSENSNGPPTANSAYLGENLINLKRSSETKVASFENVPLENSGEKTYQKPPQDIKKDDLQFLRNQMSQENNMAEIIQARENSANAYSQLYKGLNPKYDVTYSPIGNPAPINVVSSEISKQLDGETDISEITPISYDLPMKNSEIPDERSEISSQGDDYEKNTQEYGTSEKSIARYKLFNKIIPDEANESKKKLDQIYKPDQPKSDLEKERRERLLAIKKQISELREQLRAQIREEGLKLALQRREEGMKNYLNNDKKKFLAYPLMSHEHNVLSRPRRLSYFPESELSDEEPYDIVDQKYYKKKSDSYGFPILDDYEKPYINQQFISASHSPNHDHILFPLDPKTPQAVVYNDRVIPAKLYGIISVDDEEPSPYKSPNVLSKPSESIYHKYFTKHYDPQPFLNPKPIPKISETSLPFETYALPRDNYIKTIDEPRNFIPIVVLSSPIKNFRRKRSINDKSMHDRKSSEKESIDLKKLTGLKKRSIEPENSFENNRFLDRSYDFYNEIPNERESDMNSINYISPSISEMIAPKSNDISVDKFPKRFPQFLPTNNVPMGYLQAGPNLYDNPQPWNEPKVPNSIETRHFLPPIHPPLLVHQGIIEQSPPEKHIDSPQFYFWSLMHDKFKSMLGMLQSLAEWCSTSSDNS